ncbi:MAG: hypothetical protein IVW52_17480 [Acidimicrobiales bacterium]|nr:hypothetical protein [Acidimicrobiales bacterium]
MRVGPATGLQRHRWRISSTARQRLALPMRRTSPGSLMATVRAYDLASDQAVECLGGSGSRAVVGRLHINGERDARVTDMGSKRRDLDGPNVFDDVAKSGRLPIRDGVLGPSDG